MSPELLTGLRISLAGLAVTFLALGLVILIIHTLVRLFPPPPPPAAFQAAPSPPRMDPEEQRREETAAALAVAVLLAEDGAAPEGRDPTLGKLLEP